MTTVLTTLTTALPPAGQIATRTRLLNSVLWDHPECSMNTFNTYVSKLIKLGCLIPVSKGRYVVSPRPVPTTTGALAVEFYRINELEVSIKGLIDPDAIASQLEQYLHSKYYSGRLVVSLRNEWCVVYNPDTSVIINLVPISTLHLTTPTGDLVTNSWLTFNFDITHATSY